MNLTELIRDMKEKGLISVAPIKLRGAVEPVFNFLNLMNDTEAFTPSNDYCQIVGEYQAEAGGSRIPQNYNSFDKLTTGQEE